MSKLYIIFFFFVLTNLNSFGQTNITFLNGAVNNCNSQLNFILINDTTAIYTDVYKEKQKFRSKTYYSIKKTNNWLKGIEYLSSSDNSNISNISLDLQQSFIFYTKCFEDFSSCDIYFTLDNKEFSLSQLNSEAFSGDHNTQPFFYKFKENRVLYFVSDRNGGYGGLDVWFSIIDSAGNFSFPINAGPKINTIADEITPFYLPLSNTLYFSSSNKDTGLGGFDIYSSIGSLNRWETSINMSSINSEYDEMYFSLFNDKNAFFSSNRITDSSSFCCNNIYSVEFENEIIDIQDTIQDLSDNAGFVPFEIYFDNNSPNPRFFDSNDDLIFSYKKFYVDYFKNRESYYYNQNDSIIDFFFESTLKKGYKGLISMLENTLFDLSKGFIVELTIQGYASPLASDSYNRKLSSLRIKSILNFINEYSDLSLSKYISDSKLIINELPLGESESFLSVSDDPEDIKKSILSIEAILSRKVTILNMKSYK